MKKRVNRHIDITFQIILQKYTNLILLKSFIENVERTSEISLRNLRSLGNYFSKGYGPTTDSIFDDALIWEGSANRLQLFMDEDSIQVEFRDQTTEKKIRIL